MRLGFLSALVVLVFSTGVVAQEELSVADAEQYRASCTEEANAAGLEGDEQVGYIESCMREMQAENSAPAE